MVFENEMNLEIWEIIGSWIGALMLGWFMHWVYSGGFKDQKPCKP